MSEEAPEQDLRDVLKRHVGEYVAIRVYAGSLEVAGHGELSLVDGHIKAVRVGDTTLTLNT